MKHRRIALVTLLLLPPLACSATYQWKDQDGNTVYSQIPPPAGQDVRVVPPPPPPATPTEDAQQELKDLQQRLTDVRDERQKEVLKQQQDDVQAQQRAENCRMARENLRALNEGTRRLFKDNTGTYRRYTPEERAEKTEAARKVIERDCD